MRPSNNPFNTFRERKERVESFVLNSKRKINCLKNNIETTINFYLQTVKCAQNPQTLKLIPQKTERILHNLALKGDSYLSHQVRSTIFGKPIVRSYCSSSEDPQNKPNKPQEKYHTALWRRIKGYPARMRNFVIRGPVTLDKILPLFNIMFFSVAAGVLVGTTTVVSLIVWVVNRNERWQMMMAKKVGDQLKKETGINVEFDHVVGSWKEGTLKLKNVKVRRDPFNYPPDVDRNVTAIFIDIQQISVKLSLIWWIQGYGFIEKLSANGVSGDIDRRHLIWYDTPIPKRVWHRGDFAFREFKLSNVNVQLQQANPDRPLRIQIHSITSDQLRKQWLLRDLLASKSAYGIFDGSLFSLTRSNINGVSKNILKIDGLNMDLVSKSVTGPMSWITEGTFDIDIEMNFSPDHGLEKGWKYYDSVKTKNGYYIEEALETIEPIELDVKLKLNNLRAKIPSRAPDLSYIHKALAYPVVAYINTNYTCIPLNFKLLMNNTEFDGAWFPYDAGLWDALSIGVAQEFVSLVKQQQTTSNIQKNLLLVIKSFHRGVYFLGEQLQGHYDLWYFNNDDHPEDLYIV